MLSECLLTEFIYKWAPGIAGVERKIQAFPSHRTLERWFSEKAQTQSTLKTPWQQVMNSKIKQRPGNKNSECDKWGGRRKDQCWHCRRLHGGEGLREILKDRQNRPVEGGGKLFRCGRSRNEPRVFETWRKLATCQMRSREGRSVEDLGVSLRTCAQLWSQ